MKEKKNKKQIEMIILVVVILVITWFLIIHPLLKFKSMEKELLNASKRYFELNSSMLPTGSKIRKITLGTLYDKDFIKDDLKAPYTNKYCDSENSWVKVNKNEDDYQYSVYLECGIFKSKIDHKGPEVYLNGDDEIVIYQGEKYKELGVKKVIDDTDGKISSDKVKIDISDVDVNKVGDYKVTYTINDSLDNQTVKIRKVKVIQTLNNIVKKNTDATNIYKGNQENNYVLLDGILFKVVGMNEDESVKIVTEQSISVVDYSSTETWLNEKFYELLSESAKQYIKKDSKWCIDQVKNTDVSSKCSKYSKKKPIGLLSVSDYNNSKDDNGDYNLTQATWTQQKVNNSNNWYIANEKIESKNTDENLSIAPALNIIKDATIISGDGSISSPYRFKGNTKKLKHGEKISKATIGSYISYSGYTWKVIGKEEDGTTKVIMMDVLNGETLKYTTNYIENGTTGPYNPEKKENIGYKIRNDITKYIKTDLFVNKQQNAGIYENEVKYLNEPSDKTYKTKLSLVSMYDLYSDYSSDVSTMGFWYKEYSKKKNQNYQNIKGIGIIHKNSAMIRDINIRLVGYLSDKVIVSKGSGTSEDNYIITK